MITYRYGFQSAKVMCIVAAGLFVLGVLATYCAWRSGQVKGYCEGKYGPAVEVVWTGSLGITGECELAPSVPAERVVVP